VLCIHNDVLHIDDLATCEDYWSGLLFNVLYITGMAETYILTDIPVMVSVCFVTLPVHPLDVSLPVLDILPSGCFATWMICYYTVDDLPPR